jgi:hypothetical protein
MQINKHMELVLFRSVSRACLLLAVFVLLSACSPKLNWRTVQSPEQRYTALFPGKPDKLERLVPYQDQELKQALEAVKIDDDIYSISSINISAQQAALAPKIIDQLQSNLLDRAKASGGTVLENDVFYQTSNHQRLATRDYFITFNVNGKTQQLMRVRWIARPAENGSMWVYQVSVLHANTETGEVKALLSKEGYENFFNEFHPE